MVQITLLPMGETLEVAPGSTLQDHLFAHGVEFPCGGRGLCKGCKVRILKGSLPDSVEDRQRLTPREIADGWRLACRAKVDQDLTLDLAQWEAAILSDDTPFAFTPQQGRGIAVDLGTTTIVAQLLDLQTGHVLGVRTALNAQARHGADIMSRVEFAVAERGQQRLETLVRTQLSELARELLESVAGPAIPLKRVVIVGNTVMHHLFCGVNLEPLSQYPFEPVSPGLHRFAAGDLGWELPGNPEVVFLPCLGGFVGSDILAGILATRLHESESLVALMDLGTNGEIVVGNRERMLCASTAAGPAFEGARISMGMRAATGAIAEVHVEQGRLRCHVLGSGEARGICGSGLVDAVAAGLDLGLIRPNGRIAVGESLDLVPPVKLVPWDIRELQLAKGAIAAGLRILLQEWGATLTSLQAVYLAGAFGNYINQNSGRRIGLFNSAPGQIQPVGNSALLGAKIALFSFPKQDGSYPEILQRVKHVPLNEIPAFEEVYVKEMTFPGAAQSD